MNWKCVFQVFQANFYSLEKWWGYLKSRLWRDGLNSNHIKVKIPDTWLCSVRPQHIAHCLALPFCGKCVYFSGGQRCVDPLCCHNSVHCVETQVALANLTKLRHPCIPSLVCVDWDETPFAFFVSEHSLGNAAENSLNSLQPSRGCHMGRSTPDHGFSVPLCKMSLCNPSLQPRLTFMEMQVCSYSREALQEALCAAGGFYFTSLYSL